MKIAIVMLSIATLLCVSQAEMKVSVYQRTASEYLTKFETFRAQEAEILESEIDTQKIKSLGLNPIEYQAQLEGARPSLIYDLFDKVAGVYNLWHDNFLIGPNAAPGNFQLSAVMIDSCYLSYVLHLIGLWERLSGKTYKGTPIRLEVKKNCQKNLELAINYRNFAQDALELSQLALTNTAYQVDVMHGMSWYDDLEDSVFSIAPDTTLGSDHILYFIRQGEHMLVGNVQVDQIYYVKVGAGGLSGIEFRGHSKQQYNDLESLMNAQYGPSRQGNSDEDLGATTHRYWHLGNKDASADLRWWDDNSSVGPKVCLQILPD